ncbi:MAG: CD1871A family CXXC motif-containing protein [Lachnospiraceae bacterium]|nr:CD1871A family CXXC motif-containing protein [Lachnospiraceae bacterium]
MKHFLRSRLAGISFAILGLIMMGYGIFRGETAVVLTKAINICLECIGIG